MSKLTYAFYQTKAWRNLAKQFKASSNGLCAKCLQEGRVTRGEIVHHIIPLTPSNMYDPTISLNPNNLELVCRQCHADEHDEMYAEKSGRRYKLDKYGRVEIRT